MVNDDDDDTCIEIMQKGEKNKMVCQSQQRKLKIQHEYHHHLHSPYTSQVLKDNQFVHIQRRRKEKEKKDTEAKAE